VPPEVVLVGAQDPAGDPCPDDRPVTPGDVLVVSGPAEGVTAFAADQALTVARTPLTRRTREALLDAQRGLAEVLVAPRSELVGTAVFPGMVRAGTTVLAVSRRGRDVGPRPVALAEGDALLVHGSWDRIEALADTPAAHSRSLAGLLRDALAHQRTHPDQPCPVCGGRTLDAAWAERTRQELDRLNRLAADLDEAHRTVRESQQALRSLVPAPPPALAADLTADGVDTADARRAWQRWTDLLATDDPATIAGTAPAAYRELRAALEPVQAAAHQALQRRQQAWQPVADQLRAWIEAERAARRATATLTALKKAIDWLRKVSDSIRNEKLAPVAAEATEIWNMLRQESNVELGSIRLAGTGTSRRVDLNVSVDGVPGAALGVMSQGELHSLALALFLPRATMPESPFRFLVIDDPVQSMDPVKVYGLAEVLARVARHRQVIVFTHDDRLPAAVRRLDIDARILTVSRMAHSRVKVSEGGNPALRYLADAKTIACDTNLDPTVRGTVVCNLVRDALEYACHERVRARDFRAGRPVAETEAALDAARGLRPTLALALLGDAQRANELRDSLRRLHPAAPQVVPHANNGAHGAAGVDLVRLVNDAESVVERLVRP